MIDDKPLILAIDDDPSEVAPNISDGFKLEVIDPTIDDGEFSKQMVAHVNSASLILLDHRFRDETPSLSMKAQDGASFVAHLRSWARSNGAKLAPIVMFTNAQDAFANEIPAVGASIPLGGTFVGREHRLAPTLDVEWIVFKEGDRVSERLADLVVAFDKVRKISEPNGASLDDMETLLNIPSEVTWADRAKEELQLARPPVNEKDPGSAEMTRGSSQVIRWLCHRALPYPGMLMSDLFAAWSLGITVEAFKALVESDPVTPWLRELHLTQYNGPLKDFMGRRWWRAGIGQVVWQLEEAASGAGGRKGAFAVVAPTVDVGILMPVSSHAVVWTDDFREKSICSIADLVQLHPPGWPAEAMEPWMLKSEVQKDPTLKAMCDPFDLEG
jgi:hypothetical protein